jgi:biotin operon repressor
MTTRLVAAPSRLLDGIAPPDAEQATEILAGCPPLGVGAGETHFQTAFAGAALLVVEEGLVVLRTGALGARSIVAVDAGPGRVLLPPVGDEVLCGLTESRLTAITRDARDSLVGIRGAAEALLEQMALTLRNSQETIGNFANPRHVERVRLKLLQLARTYGRVARDGIRIDFPVSHTLLAQMTGSTRETVTRSLDDLQQSGFAERRGHTYHLLVAPELVLEAGSP